jgi:uncharacterized YigZ family protein
VAYVLAREVEHEEVVKGSRFIARLFRVESIDAATARLHEVRERFMGATHHGWAYRIGEAYRFSDDGEPGGTAGRPMLEVLAKRDLDEVLAVVTRYYGGIKLGAGGLVRAYAGAVAKACDAAGAVPLKARQSFTLEVPFEAMDAVHRLLDGWRELAKGEADYHAAGMRLTLSCLEEDAEALARALRDATRGTARLTRR